MAIKTFNIDEILYKEFSKHCKKHGISMSRKVENFIRQETEKLKMGKDGVDFHLELEKDTRIRPQLPEPAAREDDEHPMGKFC